jgi:AAA family ATP:ADP antiporter
MSGPRHSAATLGTPIERLLARGFRPFARVEPEETITAALMTLTVFILLTAYYLLKTAREPLILLHGGAEVKSYAAAGQAMLLVVVVQAYGQLARRVGRMKLLAIVYLFFLSNLLVFALLAGTAVPLGVPFYLWVGVFNYTAIAQFWSLAADLYTPEQGKRLFSVLGIGSSVGAVVGARIAQALVPLGPRGLMLGAAALLLACVLLIGLVDRRTRSAGPRAAEANANAEEPLLAQNAFQLLLHDKYLLLVALLTLLLNWVNSNGEYLLDRALLAAVADGAARGDPARFIGTFKADYFAWVNLLGVLLQLFAVSRILKYLGVRNALLFLPVVAFAGYGLMAVRPILALIRVGKILENSLDYSVQNTARQALYLVTSRVEKYVGKTAVDTLFVRLGDVLSAALIWVGSRMAFTTSMFASLNLMLIVAWLWTVLAVGKQHDLRTARDRALAHAQGVPT